QIFTTVPEDKIEEFERNPLDPADTDIQTPYQDIKSKLQRIARANNISISDMEFVIMQRNRETARLEALRKLQKEYPGLVVTQIKDGTLIHGLAATFENTEGKHKVLWTVGGCPEAFMNMGIAGALKHKGAVGGIRIYSKNVNNSDRGEGEAVNLAGRYKFSEKEIQELKKARPDDYEEIIKGNLLITQSMIEGSVEGSFAFITDNGVFSQDGVRDLGNDGGLSRARLCPAEQGARTSYRGA
ncbi:MAG: fructose-bisphosphatase class II, partial [Candidatus Hydrogenedentota bacterium]